MNVAKTLVREISGRGERLLETALSPDLGRGSIGRAFVPPPSPLLSLVRLSNARGSGDLRVNTPVGREFHCFGYCTRSRSNKPSCKELSVSMHLFVPFVPEAFWRMPTGYFLFRRDTCQDNHQRYEAENSVDYHGNCLSRLVLPHHTPLGLRCRGMRTVIVAAFLNEQTSNKLD